MQLQADEPRMRLTDRKRRAVIDAAIENPRVLRALNARLRRKADGYEAASLEAIGDGTLLKIILDNLPMIIEAILAILTAFLKEEGRSFKAWSVIATEGWTGDDTEKLRTAWDLAQEKRKESEASTVSVVSEAVQIAVEQIDSRLAAVEEEVGRLAALG